MIYKVKISEEAELDLEDAYRWYESIVKENPRFHDYKGK